MTTPNDKHTPTPEFVAALERTVIAELRPSSPFSRARWGQLDRVAAGVVLAVGLVLGAGTQIASAQVQAARERGELERAATVDRQTAALRLQIAQTALQRAQVGFEAGLTSRQTLLEAMSELRAAELLVMRIDLNLAEIRVTNSAPRDQLWSPLVDGRDFVAERVRIAAANAQERLTATEQVVGELQRGVQLGSATAAAFADAQRQAVQARADLELVAQRLRLREQFLASKLAAEEVAREEQRIQVVTDLQREQRLLEAAQTRLKLVQERAAIGMGTALDVKRAELEVLERMEQVQRMQLQWRQLKQRPE
jgi:hypothetical protein